MVNIHLLHAEPATRGSNTRTTERARGERHELCSARFLPAIPTVSLTRVSGSRAIVRTHAGIATIQKMSRVELLTSSERSRVKGDACLPCVVVCPPN